MSTITPIPSASAGSSPMTAAAVNDDRAKIAAVSKQFEALFVRQMLAAARKAGFGDELFGNEAGNTFREMQDSRFADIAAERGSLGLARQIEAQLLRQISLQTGKGG